MEKTITLEAKDCNRLKRLELVVRTAREAWEDALKLILPDYLEAQDQNKKINVKSMDSSSNTIVLEIEGGD